MNLTDATLLILVLAFLALGFFQGTIKLLVAILSFYVSLILAGFYFQILGRFFQQRFGTTFDVAQIVAFTLVLLVGFILLTLSGLYTFRYAKVPPALDFIDRVVGTVFGLVMGGLVIGMIAKILILLLVDRDPASTIDFPIMQSIQNGVRSSTLIPFFNNNVLPLIISLVQSFLPQSASIIFGGR
ncbi:MAG: CvpA family protein [Roseiflexaceae bacterium]|nr:CvpA family protein [Roseiflexaceae bacterium]